jgi:hypothetical protein
VKQYVLCVCDDMEMGGAPLGVYATIPAAQASRPHPRNVWYGPAERDTPGMAAFALPPGAVAWRRVWNAEPDHDSFNGTYYVIFEVDQ